MTKKQVFNIKQEIEDKRELITSLLHRKAKHIDDIAWIKGEFVKETMILNQCPDSELRNSISGTFISNIGSTWDMIVSRRNIATIEIHDIMDIHRSLANNTDDVVPGDIRFCSAYSEQLAIQIPAVANMDVMCQKISNVLYKMNTSKAPILQRAFDVHYELIKLQPFADFNKRTARMLMNWFLISRDYRPVVFNDRDDHKEYMLALRKCAHGDKRSYYNYMYKCMSRSQDLFIEKLRNTR